MERNLSVNLAQHFLTAGRLHPSAQVANVSKCADAGGSQGQPVNSMLLMCELREGLSEDWQSGNEALLQCFQEVENGQSRQAELEDIMQSSMLGIMTLVSVLCMLRPKVCW